MKKHVALVAVLFAPFSAFAATSRTFADIVSGDGGIVSFVNNYIIPLLYAVMFLLFMFGVFRYFFTGGEENRDKGKQLLLWGIIGFVVVFSIWGIVNLTTAILPQ